MKKWLPYVGIVVIAITCLVWLLRLEATASDAKELAKQNQEINAKLTAVVLETNTRLKMMLEIYGFSPEDARKWSELPRVPPRNDSNQVLMNQPWLQTQGNLQLGIMLMITDVGYDTVGVNDEGVPIVNQVAVVSADTLWDTRE
jgi:hypothetical protein